jgi:hypothetical protein
VNGSHAHNSKHQHEQVGKKHVFVFVVFDDVVVDRSQFLIVNYLKFRSYEDKRTDQTGEKNINSLLI